MVVLRCDAFDLRDRTAWQQQEETTENGTKAKELKVKEPQPKVHPYP